MAQREFHYRWQWELNASPAALWPLVSDTNRFDRDAGLPFVQRLDGLAADDAKARGGQLLRFTLYGMNIDWEERPFEWTRPNRFGVVRTYHSGPIAEMRVLVELQPRAGGGTTAIYQLAATPRNWIGALLIPMQTKFVVRRKFESAFRRYDEMIAGSADPANSVMPVKLAPGGPSRLVSSCNETIRRGGDPNVTGKLRSMIETGDDLLLARLRPYAMADEWNISRRTVLETCMHGVRAGLLEFRWDVLCPLCRGTKQSEKALADVRTQVHCDACMIDYGINFERLVELTFRPNPSIRPHNGMEYCVGGPGTTPHIVMQQRLAPGESRRIQASLEPGRYRLRGRGIPGGLTARVHDAGESIADIVAGSQGWPDAELQIHTSPMLNLRNETEAELLMMLERMTWTDQSTTASEVLAMQLFRDLFSHEALRPGEQVSVGSLCILFTDLRDSTRMYRTIGDAPAFGRVMSHFDILRDAIDREQGALVKTIGDAVMAVFTRPACAVRAIRDAHARLANAKTGDHPLVLKAGIHYGPCIAVTLNGRLDYFGSTINLAARLQALSTGNDLILSGAVRKDPEVAELIAGDELDPIQTSLKGFDEEQFELWRLGPARVSVNASP